MYQCTLSLSKASHYRIMKALPVFFLLFRTTAHPPGPPWNLTFNFYLDFETNTFKGNATWLGPKMPEGKLIEYRYVLSLQLVAGCTIVEGTISVEVCVSTYTN